MASPSLPELIREELALIEAEAVNVSQTLDDMPADPSPHEAWLFGTALAAGTERIYSGCERIFGLIAREIDGRKVDKTGSWHKDLLRSMSRSKDRRRRVIGSECLARLDELRSFRHRIRNSYGDALDYGIVTNKAITATTIVETFHAEIENFLAGHFGQAPVDQPPPSSPES
jgi:hypothetical protein